MQAIHTKYLPADHKGSRIKASCERGSLTIPYPYDLSGDEVHREAARQLLARFIREDSEGENGCPPDRNPWNRQFVTGGLPDGTVAHVLL